LGDAEPTGRSGPGVRVAETDLAILTAFCRPYLDGDRRFPCPAPNNEILRELAQNGVFLDLDTLRGHLRNLYAKFGVEDGLNPAQKRARLAELVYENAVIAGWEPHDETPAPPVPTPVPPTPAPPTPTPPMLAPVPAAAPPPPPAPVPPELYATPEPPTTSRWSGFVRYRWWLAAGGVLLLGGSVGILASLRDHEARDRRVGAPGAPVINPAWVRGAEGTVTYCTGADTVTSEDGRTQHQTAVDAFNAQFGPDVHAKLRQFADDASQQYAQISQLLQEHSGDCDVIYSDVVWTADFAHNKWLYELTPDAPRSSLKAYVDAMQDAAVYRGKVWGIPKQADAALLYYNKARVKHPPRTWQELYKQARQQPRNRLRYQGYPYEGLTVNFLELAYAIGAEDIVKPNGDANINQPDALVALQTMVEGIRHGVAPRVVVNQKETQSENAFGNERAAFMRNWSPNYAVLREGRKYPKVAGKVGVVPLPGWDGGTPVGVLGGHVLVISAFSRHPGAALKLVHFLTSRQIVKQDATDFSLAPARVDLWKDRDVQQALPAFDDLKSAVFNAKARPVTPNYPAVSRAIYSNVNRALQSYQEPQAALAQAQGEMQQALDQVPAP
jgi:multiple sugar transport system substrate-binding protein